jgi:hypothetical protein
MTKNIATPKATSARIAVKNFFAGMIGQQAAVGQMNETLTLEARGLALPLRPLQFDGHAGLGKTRFAGLIGAAREEIHAGEHRFVEIPSNVTRPQLITLLTEHAANRPATMFLDESHDLDKRVRNMLKPILETGGQIKDVRLSDQCIFPANPFQHLWLFASNEDLAAKDPALFGPTGRCSAIQFVPYSQSEKKGLIRLALCEGENAVQIDPEAVDYLESRVWANARAITQELCPELRNKALLAGARVTLAMAKAYCAGELHHIDISKRHTVARYPLGLRWVDIATLRFMGSDTKGKQVTEIANACGEPMKTTQYRLQWLSALGLAQTLANGRKALTQEGSTYLHTLSEAQKAAKAARLAKGDKAAPAPAKAPAPEAPAPVTQVDKAPAGETKEGTPAKSAPAPVKKASKPAPAKVVSGKMAELAKLAKEAGLPASV